VWGGGTKQKTMVLQQQVVLHGLNVEKDSVLSVLSNLDCCHSCFEQSVVWGLSDGEAVGFLGVAGPSRKRRR
jgi:hypothetical protein